MDDGKLGGAIHGVGQVAYAHAASWLKNPHVKIVSVSSRRKESAQKLVDKLQLDCTVGDDFDAVLHDERVDVVNISGGTLNIENRYGFRLYDDAEVYQDGGLVTTAAGKALLIDKGTYILDANGVLALNEITGKGSFYMDGGVYAVNKYAPPFTHYGGAVAPGFDQISQMNFTDFWVIDLDGEYSQY